MEGWKGAKNISLIPIERSLARTRVPPTPTHSPTPVYEYARTHACAFARDLPLSFPHPLIGIPYYPHARSDAVQISVTPGRIPMQERGGPPGGSRTLDIAECAVQGSPPPVHLPYPPFISPCFPPLLGRLPPLPDPPTGLARCGAGRTERGEAVDSPVSAVH